MFVNTLQPLLTVHRFVVLYELIILVDYAWSDARTHARTHTRTYKCVRTHTHTHTHTRTHARTHARTRAQTHNSFASSIIVLTIHYIMHTPSTHSVTCHTRYNNNVPDRAQPASHVVLLRVPATHAGEARESRLV